MPSGELIDGRLAEVARADSLLEEDVELARGSALRRGEEKELADEEREERGEGKGRAYLGLGKTEIGVDEAETAHSGPEPSAPSKGGCGSATEQGVK